MQPCKNNHTASNDYYFEEQHSSCVSFGLIMYIDFSFISPKKCQESIELLSPIVKVTFLALMLVLGTPFTLSGHWEIICYFNK